MHLGFGGNLTFERARQIRRLAEQLPLDAIVLETDAPDIAPSWRYKGRNAPDQVAGIAQGAGRTARHRRRGAFHRHNG